ncbi:hypothetical protein H6775_02810 [Candidatus Nomurabacteria bacterium]|nr:hypothetical protein [Candidatus Nomurabacteria bacterium]
MSVATVPLNKETESALENMVKNGVGSSKADVIRKAIKKLAEEQAILDVLEADRDVQKGLAFQGDLKELSKKIK